MVKLTLQLMLKLKLTCYNSLEHFNLFLAEFCCIPYIIKLQLRGGPLNSKIIQ